MSDTGIMGNSTVGAGTTMHGSVSVWLARFCGPNREQAAAALWNAYAPRLAALARRVLGTSRQRAFDAEDIVQEAFGAFFNAVEAGQYPAVANRAELWRLLAEITRNRAIDFLKGEARAKRAGGRLRGESAFEGATASSPAGLDELPDDVPFGWEFDLDCAEFLDSLEPELQEVARLRLAGFSNKEIASRLGRVEKTVERKLGLIRARWLEHVSPAPGVSSRQPRQGNP